MCEEGPWYGMILLDTGKLPGVSKFHKSNGYKVASDTRRTNVEGRSKVVFHVLPPRLVAERRHLLQMSYTLRTFPSTCLPLLDVFHSDRETHGRAIFWFRNILVDSNLSIADL